MASDESYRQEPTQRRPSAGVQPRWTPLRRFPMIVPEQTTQPLSAFDLAGGIPDFFVRFKQSIAPSLMISFLMIMSQKLANGIPQRGFAEKNHSVETLLPSALSPFSIAPNTIRIIKCLLPGTATAYRHQLRRFASSTNQSIISSRCSRQPAGPPSVHLCDPGVALAVVGRTAPSDAAQPLYRIVPPLEPN